MTTTISLGKFFLIDKSKLENIFVFQKSDLAFMLTFLGMLIAFWGSLRVWFFWPLGALYSIPCFFIFALSFAISNNCKEKIFELNKQQIISLFFFLFQIYVIIVNKKNINALTVSIFDSFVIAILVALKPKYQQLLGLRMSMLHGFIFIFSISWYLLYIVGIPLPNTTIASSDGVYTLSNYYFFVIDTNATELFPRFRSIFMEPGHVGTVCALLLYTQSGKWKKWYNILMIVALIMSFSLAAYVLFVIVIFGNMWIQRKHILPKILVIVSLLAAIGIGAYFYNSGDNMINNLIVSRLEVSDDGKLAGDNRVTESFEGQYNDFMKSGDILTGRDYTVEKFGFGNSGYRVFIYDYGLLGVLFCILFYIALSLSTNDKRAIIIMWVLAIALFWERATNMVFYNIIPIFIAVAGTYKLAESDTEQKMLEP